MKDEKNVMTEMLSKTFSFLWYGAVFIFEIQQRNKLFLNDFCISDLNGIQLVN